MNIVFSNEYHMYVESVHYRCLIFLWMRSPCSWHT